MKRLRAIIEQYWGYTTFRPFQAEAMEAVLGGKDSLLVLPTGGGKSLCFQAPALAFDGMAVVVSPLISLMKDQVDALRECGVEAASINSAIAPDERRSTHEAIRANRLKVLYVAPERMMMPSFLDYLRDQTVSFLVIDEAHCISQWGHDFRPEYRELKILKEAFPGLAVHAYTATATPQVREDICSQLGLDAPEVLVGRFDRANLNYGVTRRGKGFGQVAEAVERHRGEAGIVYCISRKNVELVAAQLEQLGHRALPYHAGLDERTRKRNQDAFSREEADVIVATVAFGMGIDKSNVRFVFHAQMPKSLEHYQQETGRAGRDGLEADCHLFYSAGDFVLWRRILEEQDAAAGEIALAKLTRMMDYCGSVECRHGAISAYFGQTLEQENCGACDLCLGMGDFLDDALELGQKILSCVVRLGRVAGGAYTALVLKGSEEQRVIDKGHDQLSTWGLLSEYPTAQIRDWIEQLAAQGCLVKVGEYNVLEVTPAGERVLKGEEAPKLLKPAEKRREKKVSKAEADWADLDVDLFEVLRRLRLGIAREKNVPPFVIFSDRTLREMVSRLPASKADFIQVPGVGTKKRNQYGTMFLRAIREYSEEKGIALAAAGAPEAAAPPAGRIGPKQLAFELFERDWSVEDVAKQIARKRSKANEYLAEYIVENDIYDASVWISGETVERVREVVAHVGSQRLKPIQSLLDEDIGQDDIVLALACIRQMA